MEGGGFTNKERKAETDFSAVNPNQDERTTKRRC